MGNTQEESKRGEASLINTSPSPFKERGIKGVRFNRQCYPNRQKAAGVAI
jgi:hypothetical protein